MMHKISLITFLILLAGCNSTSPPYVQLDSTRLNSPEVHEKTAFNIGVNYGQITQLENTNNVKIDGSEFRHDKSIEHLKLKAGLSLGKGIEASYSVSSAGVNIGAIKYQFYGANTEESDKGNVSQALRLAYQSYEASNGRFIKQDNSQDLVWENSHKAWDISWILGYRVNKQVIVYGGPFYTQGRVTNMNRETNIVDVGMSSSQESNRNKDDTRAYGANVAIEYRFQSGFGMAAEVVFIKADWESVDENNVGLNVKFDYQFE